MDHLVLVYLANVRKSDLFLYNHLISQYIHIVLGISSDLIRLPKEEDVSVESGKRASVDVILHPTEFSEEQKVLLEERLKGLDIDVTVKFGPLSH